MVHAEKAEKCMREFMQNVYTKKNWLIKLYSLQKVEKSLDTRTWLGRDRHAKAPAKLKAFCPKEERVTGRLSCFVVDARV